VKNLSIVLGTIAGIIITILAISQYNHVKIQKVLIECTTLKLGMSAERIRDIMGEPDKTGSDVIYGYPVKIWYFDVPPLSPSPFRCIMDSVSNITIEVECGDEFWIKLDFENITALGFDRLNRNFDLLNMVELDVTKDSVESVMGTPLKTIIAGDSLFWFYPCLWTGSVQPHVLFNSTTNRVISVNSGATFFVSSPKAIVESIVLQQHRK